VCVCACVRACVRACVCVCLGDGGWKEEINGDRDRLGWHIISMGLWIDVQFVCWLLETSDRLSGAARGHILNSAYRSLLIFLPLPPCVAHLFFSIHLSLSHFCLCLTGFFFHLPRSTSPWLYVFYYSSGHCYESPWHNVLIASWTPMWYNTRQSIAI